jgi:hypothetical protein
MKEEPSGILREQPAIEEISRTILHERSSIHGGSFTIPEVRSDIPDCSPAMENGSPTNGNGSLTIHGCLFRTSEEKYGFRRRWLT